MIAQSSFYAEEIRAQLVSDDTDVSPVRSFGFSVDVSDSDRKDVEATIYMENTTPSARAMRIINVGADR